MHSVKQLSLPVFSCSFHNYENYMKMHESIKKARDFFYFEDPGAVALLFKNPGAVALL